MDTKSAGAAVIGARHARTGRNGQDAAAAWAAGDAGAIVVCDGCSAGAHSEVGARLAAQVALWAIVNGLLQNLAPALVWDGVRGCLIRTLERLVEHLPGEREQAVHDQLLFTIVAAARRGDEVAVWAVGDGGYAIGARERVLGPFADNQPPYLAYELLGAKVADHLELADAGAGALVVGTDGACELGDLARFAERRFVEHPDALRRELVRCARPVERIDWDARRVERRPALLQDDGAVAVLRWRP
jgi:protein phosphatase 2C-like protein